MALDVLALGAEPRPTFAGEPRERDVHVVGCAAHDADGQLGDSTQPAVATFQIVDRARDHVADVDGLAGFRVGHQTVVGELVLAVEHRGEAARRTLQLRMRGDIVDTLVAQPHLAITGS